MAIMRLVIMTESSKFSGKCVAGIDTESGRWVRLVSDDEETHGQLLTVICIIKMVVDARFWISLMYQFLKNVGTIYNRRMC